MADRSDLKELAASIVVSYVSNNPLPVNELAGLISKVHAALNAPVGEAGPAAEAVDRPTPAQVRRSVTPEALFSFIDGKPYKTLKRHLTSQGFTPDAYRERFGLPKAYPMVAEKTRAQRRATAMAIGLGRKAKAEAAPKSSRRKRGPKVPPGD